MLDGLFVGALLLGLFCQDEAEFHLQQQSLPGLRQHFVDAGVISKTEAECYFNHPYNLRYELDLMRHRLERLGPDPPQFDFPLPDSDRCRANYYLASRFVDYLESRLKYNTEPAHAEDLELILWDAKWRKRVWSEMDDCHNKYDYDGKRVRLQRVRELIGKETFDLHQWPEPLPAAGYNSKWEPEPVYLENP